MKKKLMKKIWSGLLLSAMMVGVLQTGIEPMTVHAATTVKTMNLDTTYLAPSDGTWDTTNDHKVYFGQYGETPTPTAFRVLKVEPTTMMLDCDIILLRKEFDDDQTANKEQSGSKPNGWVNSDLEVWLNGSEYYDNSSVFTSVEKSAIVETSLLEESSYYDAGFGKYIDYAATDYVYLLSAKEADTLYYVENRSKSTARIKKFENNDFMKNYKIWWLRSTSKNNDKSVGSVSESGSIPSGTDVDYLYGVSPAFNLNRSSVLFTSANTVNKSSDLTKVSDGSSIKEWKLTLLDTGKTVAVPGGQSVTKSGDTVTVPYTYTDTGSDVSQISVMITSGAYDAAGTEILYYGKLNTTLAASGASGEGTFTLPSGLPKNYKVYILAEDVNGEKVTDYASAPAEITVAEPTANLTESTYTENQSLTLTSATGGARIYYTMTTDGSEPAAPDSSSTPYKEAISLDGKSGSDVTYRIKSIAVKDGMMASSVAIFTYTISIPETPVVDDTTAPSITTQPQNASVKEGEKATFTVAATGTAPLSYQWMIDRNDEKGWVNIDGATSEAYTTSATDMDCNGFRYKCVVTNTKGSVESNVVTLTVTKASAENPKYHITEGANQCIAENYDGTITIKADGELSKFVSVSVDGTVVNVANYTVKSGSTIVTFTKDYLGTLSVGNHTVRFTYTDGYAETTLTITKAATQPEENNTSDTTEVTTANTDTNKDEVPNTGDGTPVKVCAMLALIAGLFCLILFLANRRRNFR